MANWHGYFAIEDLNLSLGRRQELFNVMKSKGFSNNGPFPHLRNHWRFNLDKSKAIFEALFIDEHLSISYFKALLGAIFMIDLGDISHSLNQIVFDTLPTQVVTFSTAGTDYIRFAAFGGLGASWSDSRLETAAYLSANRSEWETDDGS